MEHIRKYKIEDESLDDQQDNYIQSQNSNIKNNNNNILSKINNKNILKINQVQEIIPNQQKLKNIELIKSDNNINLYKGKNINNFQKQELPSISPLKGQNNNNNQTSNSEINFTNTENNDDIIDVEAQNIQENQLHTELEESKINEQDNQNNIENINNNNEYHHVQIIDEDVENFKRRLDIMVKNFRTDTLKDFMAIKRNLLIEQKTCIENEKQKCDALLSSKSDLIEHLKDDLAKTQKELNSQNIIKEKLVEILFKKNHDKIIKRMKSLAFHGVLMKYHNKKKGKKDKIKKMRKSHWDKYKETFFKNLKQNWRDMKIYKIVSVKEKACDDKLNEMAQCYGKEINDLRNKLNEANAIIEQSNKAKAQIQENLKKVLMRGVMAMNMEAMNVLDKDVLPKTDISAIADNIMNNINISTTNSNMINNNLNSEGLNIDNNNNINQNGINIKVGINEDNNNLVATVIPANQSFQPINNTFKTNINNNILNNTNPINKDSYWKNAPSVPVDIQKNIITTDNKLNREEMIRNINNNDFLNEKDVNEDNDFDDELNSRTYNLSPMNPIDKKYINHNLLDNNLKIPQYNMNNNANYYDEMQQNILGIKNEFSMIKQNQSSMMEDSMNSYGIANKNIINNNLNINSNYKNLNVDTTNNTSNNNKSNSKKKINNNINKKPNTKNNKVPTGGKNITSNKKGTNTKQKK